MTESISKDCSAEAAKKKEEEVLTVGFVFVVVIGFVLVVVMKNKVWTVGFVLAVAIVVVPVVVMNKQSVDIWLNSCCCHCLCHCCWS